MGPQGAYLVNFLGSLIFSIDFIDPNRNGLNIKNTKLQEVTEEFTSKS